MKKLMTMMLALSFLAGTVVVSFAQDAPKKEEKKPKKAKKSKKAKKEDKKEG